MERCVNVSWPQTRRPPICGGLRVSLSFLDSGKVSNYREVSGSRAWSEAVEAFRSSHAPEGTPPLSFLFVRRFFFRGRLALPVTAAHPLSSSGGSGFLQLRASEAGLG